MSKENPREHLAFLIHDVAKRLRLEFGRRVARFDFTPAQARCLAFLAFRPGASLKALAAALEVQSMSVLRIVDELQTRKLLRREVDPDDRRALKLFLTKPGHSKVERIWGVLDDITREACAGMTASQRRELSGSLLRLSAGMQAFGEESRK